MILIYTNYKLKPNQYPQLVVNLLLVQQLQNKPCAWKSGLGGDVGSCQHRLAAAHVFHPAASKAEQVIQGQVGKWKNPASQKERNNPDMWLKFKASTSCGPSTCCSLSTQDAMRPYTKAPLTNTMDHPPFPQSHDVQVEVPNPHSWSHPSRPWTQSLDLS